MTNHAFALRDPERTVPRRFRTCGIANRKPCEAQRYRPSWRLPATDRFVKLGSSTGKVPTVNEK